MHDIVVTTPYASNAMITFISMRGVWASIDHVVLERGSEAAPLTGARILQQSGMLEQTKAIADPQEDGVTNLWSDLWRFVREKCRQPRV